MTIHGSGQTFIPANPIELIVEETNVLNLMSCFDRCHHNNYCRTFVLDLNSTSVCRLYEGSINTGQIVLGPSTTQVGSIHHYPSLYKKYRESCYGGQFDRYLTCQNGLWQCPKNTFWNRSICVNALYHQSLCSDDVECRQDIGLLCHSLSNRCICNSTSYWNGTFCHTCTPIYGSCSILGPSSCCLGTTCTSINGSFFQCQSIHGSVTTATAGPMTSTQNVMTSSPIGNDRKNATTERYSDCCKTSCAWPGKAPVSSPVQSCAQDGVTIVDNNTQSSCNSGSAYMCINQQPWNVSNTLAYGFASANILGQNESDWCCACYSLMFTESPLVGKEMIVQVTNTLSALQDIFVLQIPGSGWGWSQNACENQFNLSGVWGQAQGGISNRSKCALLPGSLQPGCYWRFDWFMNADNPDVAFKEVPCPSALTTLTGCTRF